MKFNYEDNRIFYNDDNGNLIAEVTFPVDNDVAVINHTFVDNSLRGQGVANKLLYAAVNQIRSSGLKAMPTCSYAIKWFKEHPEYSDILL